MNKILLSSPFGGKVYLVFHGKDRGMVYADRQEPITINGVKMNFSIQLGVIDGQWEIGCESCGQFIKNSASNLRLNDWASNKLPSDSAYRKVREYLDGVLALVRSGRFNADAHEGEKNRLKNVIARRVAEIAEKEKEILTLQQEKDLLQKELDALL